MKNKLGTEIAELDERTFLAFFDPEVHTMLRVRHQFPGVEATVCCQVLALDSSSAGRKSALVVGPGCTFGLDEVPEIVLGATPSVFAYPVAIWRKETK